MSRSVVHSSSAVLAIVALAGCGGESRRLVGAGGGGQGGIGGHGSSASGGTSGAAAGVPAIDTLPECKTTLTPGVGLPCYQTPTCVCRDPRDPTCELTLACENFESVEAERTCPSVPELCPSSVELARDTRCHEHGAACTYSEQTKCYCAHESEVGHGIAPDPCDDLHWYCGDPPPCPAGVPDLGSPCTRRGEICGNACRNRYARECIDGTWQTAVVRGECV
jgi:hypothetical protein